MATATIGPDTIIRDLVNDHPAALRVLHTYHVDFCCGGNRPLADGCLRAGVAVEDVVQAIADEEARVTRNGNQPNWSRASCADLIGHIVETHHVYTREELTRLAPLMQKVARVHGERHPELLRLATLFQALAQDMAPHLMREERILFPFILGLEAGDAPAAPFGHIGQPLAVMDADHASVGRLLAEMRAVTHDYQPPDGACGSYRALYQGLAALERDIHLHVHLENNILFPKARALAEGGVA